MNPPSTCGPAEAPSPDEIELKLEIDPTHHDRLSQSAALSDVAFTDREQVATYYDTSDHQLRAAAVSLRVRRVGTRHVQTIKAGGGTAAGMFARSEWEQEVDGPGLDLASAFPLHRLVPGEVLQRLAPVFTVAVTRRVWLVERDGATIELVADHGVVRAGDRSTPISEIELELKSGPAAAIFALARDLGRELPLRLGVLTKAERGYRLIGAGGMAGVKAERLALKQDATVAEAFDAIVGNCLRHYRLNEESLRDHPQPEALHQARVALRRLRSALSIFKPVVADEQFEHLAAELRWLAGSLGDARDLDVLVKRLGDTATDAVTAAHARAYEAALAALESQRTRDMMIELVQWVAAGTWRQRPLDPAMVTERADAFAAETLGTLRRRIKRRGRHLAAIDDAERHRVRILAKKLRYATGFFDTLFTGRKARRRYKPFLKQLELLQEHLGELNDHATAPTLMTRFGLDAGPAISASRRETLLADAAEAHAALIDAKRFW